MPRPPTITGTLKNWYFNKHHELCGSLYYHSMYDDGVFHTIANIQSISDYPDGSYLIKTHGDVFVLYPQDEDLSKAQLPIKHIRRR